MKKPKKQPKKTKPLDSVAIKRLVEEVKVNKDQPLGGYNRTYHRHNR